MNKIGILDIQCLCDNNGEYVVKELALLPLNLHSTPTSVPSYVFKAPFTFKELHGHIQQVNGWNTKNYHHLSWEEGSIPYDELPTILTRIVAPYKMILVMGLEKTKFITSLVHKLKISLTVVNIEPILISLKKIMIEYTPCSHDGVCAVRNCFKIRKAFFEL